VAEKVEDGAGKISSSAVRDALRAGRPELAQAIMGRPFAIEGLVQKGRQLGRQLGFPTANVPLGDYVAPKLGVYATRTRLADGRIFGGVANIGVNPTTGIVDARLEVWLFDFDEDIYGEVIETDLIEFLRPEETFRDAAGQFDVPAMVEQVLRDAAQARAILNQTPG
jgi:riboflavin kinase/FMN adenylyltransferase